MRPLDERLAEARALRVEMVDPRPGWQEWAACRGEDPALFHPPKEDTEAPGLIRKVCARCPVWRDCRSAGIGEVRGWWGGLSPRERRRVRRFLRVETEDEAVAA